MPSRGSSDEPRDSTPRNLPGSTVFKPLSGSLRSRDRSRDSRNCSETAAVATNARCTVLRGVRTPQGQSQGQLVRFSLTSRRDTKAQSLVWLGFLRVFASLWLCGSENSCRNDDLTTVSVTSLYRLASQVIDARSNVGYLSSLNAREPRCGSAKVESRPVRWSVRNCCTNPGFRHPRRASSSSSAAAASVVIGAR